MKIGITLGGIVQKILLLCLLVIHLAAYSLQQSRQLARSAPRAGQVLRPALVRPRVPTTPASWQPSARSSAAAIVPETASGYQDQEHGSWRQQQSHKTRSSFADTLLYASPLVSVGLVSNWDRNPVPMDQALKLVHEHAQEVIQKVAPRKWSGDTSAAAVQFSWLPGYIIKLDGESRKIGEKILRDSIDKNNLNLIIIPKQVQFSLPGSHNDFCLCERIAGIHNNTITAAQMEQLIILIKSADPTYWDVTEDNMIFTDDGKIAFIDTELRGFYIHRYAARMRAFRILQDASLTPAARQILEQAIDEL